MKKAFIEVETSNLYDLHLVSFLTSDKTLDNQNNMIRLIVIDRKYLIHSNEYRKIRKTQSKIKDSPRKEPLTCLAYSCRCIDFEKTRLKGLPLELIQHFPFSIIPKIQIPNFQQGYNKTTRTFHSTYYFTRGRNQRDQIFERIFAFENLN